MFVYNVGPSSSSLEGRVLADGVEDKRSASPSPLLRSFVVPSFGEENSRNAERGATRGRRRQTSSFPLRGRIISVALTRRDLLQENMAHLLFIVACDVASNSSSNEQYYAKRPDLQSRIFSNGPG